MIPDNVLEKQQKVRITLDSPPMPTAKESKKKYELVNGTSLFRVIRQYGSLSHVEYQSELYLGTVKAGDYKFPFSIPTSNFAHSSFHYRSDDGITPLP